MQASAASLPTAGTADVTATGDLQVLLIRLGTRTFGVPLDHVRYVATLPADFVCYGEATEAHFVFEGSPLAFVSLWNLLGQKSEYAEYEEMLAMLPQRRQDHLDWMNALDESIRSGASFAKARNPRECAFGKWYYGQHSKDRRLSLLLGQFEIPHATIHGLADRLLALSESGQRAAALQAFEEARDTTLAKLMKLFDSAQALVVELQRRIAVIVADGDDICALGADGVRDIVDIPAERIKPNTGNGIGAGSKATAALIILDDRNVVPLLNWRNFCAAEAAATV